MCGITGIINFSNELTKFDIAKKNELMSLSISHRGPDEFGYYNSANCSISNRRLSIVDIQNGKQPIRSEDGRYTMVYNGECYNFKELRKDLEIKNITFKIIIRTQR